jgi:hypothetical protein
MAATFWDDRFQRQVEILQAGPKKPWMYYIPRGSGHPDRVKPIDVDDIITIHQLLEVDTDVLNLLEVL